MPTTVRSARCSTRQPATRSWGSSPRWRCSRRHRRSTAAPIRCRRTSSASASSACRRSRTRTRLSPSASSRRTPEPSPGCRVDRSAVEHAVGVGRMQLEQQATVVDHRLAVLGPVVVLAGEGTVVLDQRVDGGIIGRGRHREHRHVGLDHRIGPEVVAVHVERRPRVASQIGSLRPIVGDRDADHVVVAHDVGDVRRLRPAIGLEGEQHPVALVAGEVESSGEFHAEQQRGTDRVCSPALYPSIMASSAATTVEDYLDELPGDRAEVVRAVRELVLANLPDGVVETMNWGMIAYEIPLDRHPDTYNGQPLLYAALAAQKRHYALYLHSVYTSEADAQRLQRTYDDAGVKLDVGRSCVRFKRLDQLLPEAIADAIGAVTVDEFIDRYESAR